MFLKECTPPQAQDLTDGPGPSQASASLGGGASKSKVQPLKGFKVYLIGRLSQTKPQLTQQIESLGGRVVSTVSETTTICISNESECECVWGGVGGWGGGGRVGSLGGLLFVCVIHVVLRKRASCIK